MFVVPALVPTETVVLSAFTFKVVTTALTVNVVTAQFATRTVTAPFTVAEVIADPLEPSVIVYAPFTAASVLPPAVSVVAAAAFTLNVVASRPSISTTPAVIVQDDRVAELVRVNALTECPLTLETAVVMLPSGIVLTEPMLLWSILVIVRLPAPVLEVIEPPDDTVKVVTVAAAEEVSVPMAAPAVKMEVTFALTSRVVMAEPIVTEGTAPLIFNVVTVPVPAVVKLVVCAATFKAPIAALPDTLSLTVSVLDVRFAVTDAVVTAPAPVADIVITLVFTAPIFNVAIVFVSAIFKVDKPPLLIFSVVIASFAFSVPTSAPMSKVPTAELIVSAVTAPLTAAVDAPAISIVYAPLTAANALPVAAALTSATAVMLNVVAVIPVISI